MPNYEKIERLRDYLIEHKPADFDMRQWCACVGGYAFQVLTDGEIMPSSGDVAIQARLCEILEISADEALDLTYPYLLNAPESDLSVATIATAIDRLESLLLGKEMVA